MISSEFHPILNENDLEIVTAIETELASDTLNQDTILSNLNLLIEALSNRYALLAIDEITTLADVNHSSNATSEQINKINKALGQLGLIREALEPNRSKVPNNINNLKIIFTGVVRNLKQ